MSDAVSRLSDFRALYVLARVEGALEGYTRRLLSCLPDGPVRDAAAGVMEDGAAHRGLFVAAAGFEAAVADVVESRDPEVVLEALLDAELFAHDFYAGLLERVHDRGTAEVVRAMVREESVHVDAVRQAQALT